MALSLIGEKKIDDLEEYKELICNLWSYMKTDRESKLAQFDSVESDVLDKF